MATSLGAADAVKKSPLFPRGSVITVGTFDGVHIGHRAVIAEVTERARAADRARVLVTFEPHPLAVLRPQTAPGRLTTALERSIALAETGLDFEVVLRFDERLSGLEPEAFVEKILIDRLGLVELVVGHDHGFGRDRKGDVPALKRLAKRLGFPIVVVPPVIGADGRPMSSSRIREAIGAADFPLAAALLGRAYGIIGRVVPGKRRGRSIGIPTANIAPPPEKLLPPDGVYAVRVEWGGGTALGMMNQGGRPTVGDEARLLEVNLFDFEGDLYGRDIRIEWVQPIRPIRRFESLDALRDQLARDRTAALAILGASSQPNNVSVR